MSTVSSLGLCRRIKDTVCIEDIEAKGEFLNRTTDTIPDFFDELARNFDHKAAFRFLNDAHKPEVYTDMSFLQLRNRIYQAANLFSALGASVERPVAHIMPPTLETHPIIWGAATSASCCPINPFLEASAIAQLLVAANCHVLVFPGGDLAPDIWEKAQQVAKLCPSGLCLLRVGEGGDAATEIDYFDRMSTMRSDQLTCARPLPDSIAAIFHTGGTTGAPKLVRQTHGQQILAAFISATMFEIDQTDAVLCGMPLFHVGGLFMGGLTPFSAGAMVVQLTMGGFRNPDVVENFWNIVRTHRPTIMSGVPTIYAALAQQECKSGDASSLRYAISSASGLPSATRRQWEAQTSTPINEVYGLTEATFMVSANPLGGELKPGSVGIHLPHVKMKTVRQNATGEWADCEANEVGELFVKGPTVFGGYETALNAETFVDGWFRSGDLATIDEDGFLHITGRQKDVIIRGGHNIDPLAIEDVLYKHPSVKLCAAIGRPDPYVGEMPVAFVQLVENACVSETELLAFTRKEISERAAQPKSIHIVTSLPVTAVGKIFKPALRQQVLHTWFSDLLRQELRGHFDIEEEPLRLSIKESGGSYVIHVYLETDGAKSTAAQAIIHDCLSLYDIGWEIHDVDE